MSDVSQIAARAGDTGLTIFLSLPLFILELLVVLLALTVGTLFCIFPPMTPSDDDLIAISNNFINTLFQKYISS